MKGIAKSFKGLFLLLLFVLAGCQNNTVYVTMAKFENLLKEGLISKVIVVESEDRVVVHINKSRLANSKYKVELEGHDIYAIGGIETDYFVDKYDDFVELNPSINAPTLMFELCSNIRVFLTTYGFLLILVVIALILFIVLPLKVISQKKKIRDLEARIATLEQKNK